MILNILIISISLSVDALGIGIAYHLKGVKIEALEKLIIGSISGLIMWISLSLGKYMTKVLPESVMNLTGISILILMGVIFIRNSLFNDEGAKYDLDQSKKIELFEAIILGFALSADSISAGIASAAIGLINTMIPVVVGLMQVFFLSLGYYIANHTSLTKHFDSRTCGVFSGALLILIAILRCMNGI